MQRGTIDRRGFVGGFAALAWGGWPRGIAAMPARAQDQARLTGQILWPGRGRCGC